MILKREYDFDVTPGGEPLIIRASKNDSSSQIVLNLLSGTGQLDIPSGAKFYIQGRALDGAVRCSSTYRLNQPRRVTVNLTKEITGKAGKKLFEIVAKATENNVTYNLVTATFYLDIR